MKASPIALLSLALSAPLPAQWLSYPTPGIPRTPAGKPNLAAPAPRTPDGKPDLSGLWNKLSPKYSRNIAADLKPGEVQPWAEALVEQRHEDLERGYMNVLCVPLESRLRHFRRQHRGGDDEDHPDSRAHPHSQPRSHVSPGSFSTSGRALETAPNPSWMGYSAGHWDGDTLWWSRVSASTIEPGWITMAIPTPRRCA